MDVVKDITMHSIGDDLKYISNGSNARIQLRCSYHNYGLIFYRSLAWVDSQYQQTRATSCDLSGGFRSKSLYSTGGELINLVLQAFRVIIDLQDNRGRSLNPKLL
jgi:hypothetical protein